MKDPGERRTAIDHELIRELARLLEETGLTEIEFERDGQRVRVARAANMLALSTHPLPAAAIGAPDWRGIRRSGQAPRGGHLTDGGHCLSRTRARR